MIDRLGANAVPVQLPIGAEADFEGIIDLIGMKAIIYKDDLGKDLDVIEIPERATPTPPRPRASTCSTRSRHYDDELAEAYLEDGRRRRRRSSSAAIRQATLAIAA